MRTNQLTSIEQSGKTGVRRSTVSTTNQRTILLKKNDENGGQKN